MTTIIVLFNLKDGSSVETYENWARETDLKTVRGLSSVSGFEVFRTNGLLGSDDASPYQYVEIISVGDMAKFGEEISTDVMQKVAGEFQSFADNPMFIMSESIEG